jgi:hypothetical protein
VLGLGGVNELAFGVEGPEVDPLLFLLPILVPSDCPHVVRPTT